MFKFGDWGSIAQLEKKLKLKFMESLIFLKGSLVYNNEIHPLYAVVVNWSKKKIMHSGLYN